MAEDSTLYSCEKCGDENERFLFGDEGICPSCGARQGNWTWTDSPPLEEIDPPDIPVRQPLDLELQSAPAKPPVEAALIEDQEELSANRSKTIAVIGYSDSGKTFLINRMLDHTKLSDSLISLHQGKDGIQTTETETIDKFDILDNSIPRLLGCDGYRLVDMAGEHLVEILTGPDRETRLIDTKERVVAKTFIEAIIDADAFLLVVPTPHLFARDGIEGATLADLRIAGGDETSFEDGQKVLGQITTLFAVILSILNHRGKKGREKLLAEGLNADDLGHALSSRQKIKVPFAITFSQTDRLLGHEKAKNYGVDGDPWFFAVSMRRTLFKAVVKHCRNFRFSFTTAFENHPQNSPEVDYTSNHYGVEDTFQWLFDELFPAPAPIRWIRNILRGHSPLTSASKANLRLRRMTDSNFRKHEKG